MDLEALEQLLADLMERRAEAGERISRAQAAGDATALAQARADYRRWHNRASEVARQLERKRRGQ